MAVFRSKSNFKKKLRGRAASNYWTLISSGLFSVCLFESGISGKEVEKIQKFEYLENEKSFLDEIKKFSVFEGLTFGEKIKK